MFGYNNEFDLEMKDKEFDQQDRINSTWKTDSNYASNRTLINNEIIISILYNKIPKINITNLS